MSLGQITQFSGFSIEFIFILNLLKKMVDLEKRGKGVPWVVHLAENFIEVLEKLAVTMCW